ncbi:MAG: lipid A deacylase LpxR family protein [Cytophagales bacterium]|nr:lipid A deacylase LpxR family protein [Cytophagales bacterium]
MIRSLILCVVLVYFLRPAGLYGQHAPTHQIAAQVDNDRFNFAATDKYYSNGIILKWNRTIHINNFFLIGLVEKAILVSSLQHKIYTPSEIIFYDKQRHDRPYASTLTLSGGVRLFIPKNQFIQADITLGVSGPWAGGQNLQEWWHRQINVFKPRGWENQIVNSPVVNLHLQHARQWFETKIMNFISTSELNLGTLSANVKQEGLVRVGKFLPLNLSTFSGGDLENGPFAKKSEIYLFAGAAIEYVYYNGLIEGNWIGNESPHTRQAVPWVYHGKYGVQWSTWKVSAAISYHLLSREVRGGTDHQYVRLNLGFRF